MFAIGIIQTIIFLLTLIVASYAAREAAKIGKKQNSISEQLLKLEKQTADAQSFADLSVQPVYAGISEQQWNNGIIPNNWDLIIKGIGVYPVYINKYVLDTAANPSDVHPLGNMAIPPDGLVVQFRRSGIQDTFNLIIDFTDYRGNKYQSIHRGLLINGGRAVEIRSEEKKAIEQTA